MKSKLQIPRPFWRVMSWVNRRMLVHYGGKSKAAKRVLVLTTTGRKSGLAHITPLQYEEVDGVYYVTSARGTQADWYKNILECPMVQVQVGKLCYSTIAKPTTDTGQIADILELRLRRHHRFMKAMLSIEGLPRKYKRADLEMFASRLAIVTLPSKSMMDKPNSHKVVI